MGGKTRRSASIDAFSTFSATLFEGGKGRKGPRKTPERRTGGGGGPGRGQSARSRPQLFARPQPFPRPPVLQPTPGKDGAQ
jgi:hypothetical protein